MYCEIVINGIIEFTSGTKLKSKQFVSKVRRKVSVIPVNPISTSRPSFLVVVSSKQKNVNIILIRLQCFLG